MRNRKLVSIVVMFAFMHSWLHAAVIPGRWEKVSDLESGSNITVSLDTGDVLRGEFIASDRESIRMIVDDQERKYPKMALLKVSLLKLGWSRKKKAGIGWQDIALCRDKDRRPAQQKRDGHDAGRRDCYQGSDGHERLL